MKTKTNFKSVDFPRPFFGFFVKITVLADILLLRDISIFDDASNLLYFGPAIPKGRVRYL